MVTKASTLRESLRLAPRASGTMTARGRTGRAILLADGEYNLGKIPLLVPSCCAVIGESICSTRLIYDGPGKAVQFMTYAGHRSHQRGTIANLSILSEGDGIGMADDCAESEWMTVRDLVLDCAGTPLAFRHTQLLYFLNIGNVHIAGAGNMVLDAPRIRNLNLHRLTFANNTRALKPGLNVPTVNVGGNGAVRDCRFENDWGGDIWRMSGLWETSNNTIESPRDIVLDDARVTAHDTMDWTRQPKNPARLFNHSELHALRLGLQNDGGGADVDPNLVYRCDDTSCAVSGGKAIAGVGVGPEGVR